MRASTYTAKDGSKKANWTLINLTLEVFGPMPEARLTKILLAYQIVFCAVGLFFRLRLASQWYGDLK